MVTSTGQYISWYITETGLMVFGTLTESGEYALNNRVEYMVMSGGIVSGGVINANSRYCIAMQGGAVTGGTALETIRKKVHQTIGGMVTCGLISSHAYASNMRHLESTSCDYSFTGTKIDKRFTAMEV